MATFAGGYAIHITCDSMEVSVFFALFWGALIFNLDRYIVSTLSAGTSGKVISKQNILEATPRLLMAILLGFVIATPLELKLFEKEINAEISNQIAAATDYIGKSVVTDPILMGLKRQKETASERIKSKNQLIDKKRQVWNKAEKDKNDEWAHGTLSGKRGRGEYYEDLKRTAEDAENDYLTTKATLDEQNVTDNALINDLD